MSEKITYDVMFFPTRIHLPLWARRRATILRGALNRLKISDFSVRRLVTRYEKPRGLMRPLLDVRFPPAIRASDYLGSIRTEDPVDGSEIVEWMHFSHADRLIMSARILEYNRAGSHLIGESGDGYIPGVSVEELNFRKIRGRTVSSQGYAVADTPVGSFSVRSLGKGIGVFKDLIAGGTMSYCGSIQWCGNLLKWKELAKTPIRQAVGFFMDSRGNVLPNFFEQIPTRPKLRVEVRQRFTSSDAQTINVRFRDPTDYSRVLGMKTFDVSEGTSEVRYTTTAFPYVPPLVAEISPEDDKETTVEEYVVV